MTSDRLSSVLPPIVKTVNLPFLTNLAMAWRETSRMRAASAWEIHSSDVFWELDRLDKWVDSVNRLIVFSAIVSRLIEKGPHLASKSGRILQ